ncbi:glycoside hydrolase family 3 C-terminal domain-containing protein [Streptomyces sp. NBC_01431]
MLALGDRAGLFGRGASGAGCDVESIELPGVQRQLLGARLDCGTPVVVTLLAGRPYALGRAVSEAAAIRGNGPLADRTPGPATVNVALPETASASCAADIDTCCAVAQLAGVNTNVAPVVAARSSSSELRTTVTPTLCAGAAESRTSTAAEPPSGMATAAGVTRTSGTAGGLGRSAAKAASHASEAFQLIATSLVEYEPMSST